MALASLILGIVGIGLAFLFPYISPVLGIVGIILAVIGGKKLKAEGQPAGKATAGMILSIISVVLGIIMSIVVTIAVSELLL